MTLLISIDVGIKNLGVCVLREDTKEILVWELLCTTGKIPNILAHLGSIDYFYDDDEVDYVVVIERQPRYNPKMRVVSAVIETFFLMSKPPSVKMTVRKPHAMDKWRKTSYWNTEELKDYACRKKISIRLCELLISSKTWKEHMNSFKKKDDLADSFLQGFFL